MQVWGIFRGGALLLSVVCATFMVFPAQGVAAAYRVQQITNESLPLSNLGLNNQGQLAWQTGSSIAPSYHVYLYSAGAIRMLSNPDTPAHFPKLNHQGQVTWQNNNTSENNQICLFSDNQVFTLASGVQYHNPYQPQINNSGQVLWWTDTTQLLRTQIFLYSHATKTTVPITDGTTADYFSAFNDNGAIAWDRVIGIVGPDHAICLYGAGPLQEISGRGSYTAPILINNRTQVLYHGFGDNAGNLYLYDAGPPTIIASNPNYPPINAAMNNQGQVVYQGRDANGAWQIYLYYQGNTLNLSQSLDPESHGLWNLSPAINDRGQVVWVHTADDPEQPLQLILYDAGRLTQVTRELYLGISEPRINDQGQIAWIGIPSAGTGQVFLATPVSLACIYYLLFD